MDNYSELTRTMIDLDEDKVYQIVKQRIAQGDNPMQIVRECNEGMFEIGLLFEREEYFLTELIMAGEIFKNVMVQLEPMLGDVDVEKQTSKGTVVIGTVQGDVHDIGKDIVVSMLRGTGYEVFDLGVDVPTEKFVKSVQETGAKVLGLSCLLNFTFPNLKNVVDGLTDAGLKDTVKVLIGGAPCNEDVLQFTGADYWGKDAAAAVKICDEIYK